MAMKSALAAMALAMVAAGGEPPRESELRPDTFERFRRQIRPQADESRWLDVPWHIDLHEARRKAAAEGKPLFIQAGGKANTLGYC